MTVVSYDFPKWSDYLARSLVLLCTLIPLNAIKCFVSAIEPISRLNRITPKLQLIRIIVPILQIQQLTISWLVKSGYIEDLQNMSSDYRGSRIEGTLMSFEMLIVVMCSHFVYRVEDLKHWKHKQLYQWMIQPAQKERSGYEHIDEMPISELSGISAMSSDAPSTLLAVKDRNGHRPLIS